MSSEEKDKKFTQLPLDVSKVEAGHLLTFVRYFHVKTVAAGGSRLEVCDTNQQTFGIHGKELVEACFSADWFQEEVAATKTAVAERLVSAGFLPFTVCFLKQDGEERILRGRLVAPEPLLGRSHVEDLDIKDGLKPGLRLVDHRTIKWLIINGVKYKVK